MQEIRTSGSMSGDGKRSVAAWPKLPRPFSTLPSPLCDKVCFHGDFGRVSGPSIEHSVTVLEANHAQTFAGTSGEHWDVR